MPISKLMQWLDEERQAGAPDPKSAVLATVTPDAIPHSRVVAIREINDQGLLFFTQKSTRKVSEIENNPHVSLTFWLELKERQVSIDGEIELLSQEENESFWITYPRFSQIRFTAYAPTSGQPIQSKNILEEKKLALEMDFQNIPVPYNPLYCGYRIKPTRFLFYTYRTDELSDVSEYIKQNGENWRQQIISP